MLHSVHTCNLLLPMGVWSLKGLQDSGTATEAVASESYFSSMSCFKGECCTKNCNFKNIDTLLWSVWCIFSSSRRARKSHKNKSCNPDLVKTWQLFFPGIFFLNFPLIFFRFLLKNCKLYFNKHFSSKKKYQTFWFVAKKFVKIFWWKSLDSCTVLQQIPTLDSSAITYEPWPEEGDADKSQLSAINN